MIRAHRVNATAQDDASPLSGWNIAPNVEYSITLLPGATSCGVLVYADGVLVASGAALTGTEQPCVLLPQGGYALGMIDAELGWHLLLTTTGTESQRTIRINPAVDLPDEIHPIYGDDDLALVRATAGIDASAHYIDELTVSCPLGLGSGLGAIADVPVDGVAVVGQVESITWSGTPNGASEQAVIRRHVAIAPVEFAEPVLPTVTNDAGATTHQASTSGNVLANDDSGLTVVAVNGLSANVGVAVTGNNGGSFAVNSDGAWTFAPGSDFDLLAGSETADTSVTYHASDGQAEAMATLTVTVSHANAAPIAVDDAGETTADATTSGNVLANDTDAENDSLAVSRVAGSSANVGEPVAGSNGGLFTIGSDGAWIFNPNSEFALLTGEQTATTSVTYSVSDGQIEDDGTLTVTVSAAAVGISLRWSTIFEAASSSVNVDLPVMAEGDLVLFIVYTDQSASWSETSAFPATGYSFLARRNASDTWPVSLFARYKAMGSTSDSVLTIASVSIGHVVEVQVWRGVDASTPIDAVYTGAGGANSYAVNSPAITTVTDGAAVISAGLCGCVSAQSPGAPSGYTLINSSFGAGAVATGGSLHAMSAYAIVDNAGAVDPPGFSGLGTHSSAAWAAVTIALRPA